ncbi:hypothetical protein HN681_04965 [archaeon]|nr:hypothetical protein [Candidatus Woesearchaeota archaeon]MBT8010769.1 hypothetical protein [archaeon]
MKRFLCIYCNSCKLKYSVEKKMFFCEVCGARWVANETLHEIKEYVNVKFLDPSEENKSMGCEFKIK